MNDILGQMGQIRRPSRLRRNIRWGKTVAIIIDDTGLQLAAAAEKLYSRSLLDCTRVYFPSSLKDPTDRTNFIITELQEFIKVYSGRNTRYIIGITGMETTFRKIYLPDMPARELDRAVFWEGSKRVPFGLADACYGYYLESNLNRESSETHTVSLLAIPRQEIENRLELLRPINLKISSVWHEQEAVGHLLARLPDFAHDKTQALLNIRRSGSLISYYRGTSLEFVHSSNVGTDSFRLEKASPSRHEQFLESLASEIQNSLDFYAGQYSANFSSDILVYGDLAYSEEIIERLSHYLGLKIRPMSPEVWGHAIRHIQVQDETPPILPCLGAVALALADYDLIDFLPREMLEKKSQSRLLRMALPAVAFYAFILAGIWFSMDLDNRTSAGKLDSIQDQIERFRRSDSFIAYGNFKRQMAADRAFLEKIKSNPSYLHLNLMELSRITPPKIKLDEFELIPGSTMGRLTLTGKAFSQDPPPEVILAEFVTGLENSPFYDKIKLTRHAKRQAGNEFVINFQIEMEAVI